MRGEFRLLGEKVVVTGTEEEVFGKGYGRKKGRLELSLEEAAFLLETGRLQIKQLNFKEFLEHALSVSPRFGVRYLVYRDLKDRGYAVQPAGGGGGRGGGGVGFWLYPRGAKPGEKPAKYFIRIFSELDFLALSELGELLALAENMRKESILAVVDAESDVTYYELKEAKFEGLQGEKKAGKRERGEEEEEQEEEQEVEQEVEQEEEQGKEEKKKAKVSLLGDRVVLLDSGLAESLYKKHFYGKLTKERRLLLSFVEATYLSKAGLLETSFKQFVEHATAVESDFLEKYAVYEDLRANGLVVKTGFKFGSHFRVYKAGQQKHSSYLIHVLPKEHIFSLPELSRAVRLAHGVRKRMIFAHQTFREQTFRKSLIKSNNASLQPFKKSLIKNASLQPFRKSLIKNASLQKVFYVEVGRKKL